MDSADNPSLYRTLLVAGIASTFSGLFLKALSYYGFLDRFFASLGSVPWVQEIPDWLPFSPRHLTIGAIILGLVLIYVSRRGGEENPVKVEQVRDVPVTESSDQESPDIQAPAGSTGTITSNIMDRTVIDLDDLDKPNYPEQDSKTEWPIYQLAYLWYDRQYPRRAEWNKRMPIEVEDQWEELRRAVQEDDLSPSGTHDGRIFIPRDELREYAQAKGEKPPFLFPEERND